MAPSKKSKPTQVGVSAPTPSTPVIPFWKKPWVWFSTSVIALAAVLTSVISILSDARALPSEWQKTSDQFFEWYGEYDAWKGYWTNSPGGDVDAAPLNLADEDFRIMVDETGGGRLAGTIESKGICEKIPYHEQFLFDGTISSSSRAKIEVFNHIEGYRRALARLTLQRDGNVMTVIPDEDPTRVFGKETRIALDTNEFMDNYDREPLCGGKSLEFIQEVFNEAQQRSTAKTSK